MYYWELLLRRILMSECELEAMIGGPIGIVHFTVQ